MSPPAPSTPSIRHHAMTLEVVTGLHRGAIIELESGTCRIGTDDTSDVWLGDPDIAPVHVVLRFHGRQMAVEAIGGDVSVNGRIIAQGTGVRSELPACIDFADVSLRITPPPTRSFMSRLPHFPVVWHRTASRLVPFVALSTTIGVLIVYEFIGANQADANIGPSAAPVTLDNQAIDSARQIGAVSRQDASQALKERLSQAGLHLSVGQQENYLSVSGEYTPDQAGTWQQIQHWFDRRYGSEQMLLNEAQLKSEAEAPDLQLRAVWLGDNPYVIDDRGERLYPGASLSSGWIISSINDDRVLLSRGDTRYALTH